MMAVTSQWPAIRTGDHLSDDWNIFFRRVPWRGTSGAFAVNVVDPSRTMRSSSRPLPISPDIFDLHHRGAGRASGGPAAADAEIEDQKKGSVHGRMERRH